MGRTRVRPEVGAGVVLAIVIMAIPAALAGVDVAWLLVAMGAAALALAPVAAIRELRAIQGIELPAQFSAHAGRSTPIRVRIRTKRTLRHVLFALDSQSATPRDIEAAPLTAAVEIADGRSCALFVRLPRRGPESALVLRAVSTFPFGLFQAERTCRQECSVRGLPRLRPRAHESILNFVHSKSARMSPQFDEDAGTGQMRGLSLGLRPYRTMDTARDIAWRASFARGRLLAHDRRTRARDAAVTIIVARQTLGAERAGSKHAELAFEAAISQAATAVHELSRAGMRVDLVTHPPMDLAPLDSVGDLRPTHFLVAHPRLPQSVTSETRVMDALTDLVPVGSGLAGGKGMSLDRDAFTASVRAAAAHGERTIAFVGVSSLEFQRAASGDESHLRAGTRHAKRPLLLLGIDAAGRCAPLPTQSAAPSRSARQSRAGLRLEARL